MNKKLVAAIAVGAAVAGSAWYIYKVRSYLLMKVDPDGIKENVSALPYTDTRNWNTTGNTYMESFTTD
jgi:hypothetical protein